jgi:hypothetical protein
MQLAIDDARLTLTLEGAERLWAAKLAPISVPRAHVVQADNTLQPASWLELRAPGTFVPYLIKAGTYYTRRGKEFWCVVRSRKEKPLTIELKDAPYQRLVITIDDHENWAARINAWVRG